MNHVVIFAGGVGSRMGVQSRPKQFLTLEGKEIIVYTIEKFQEHPGIDAIYIACHPDWIDFMKKALKGEPEYKRPCPESVVEIDGQSVYRDPVAGSVADSILPSNTNEETRNLIRDQIF